MTFITLETLPSSLTNRASFRQARRIYRKYPNQGKITVKNLKDTRLYCPCFGYRGIYINAGDTVDTYLRNPISYTKAMRLRNWLYMAAKTGDLEIVTNSNTPDDTPTDSPPESGGVDAA
ncbi:MAG: hypothetical protein Q4D38_00050 [Planctomycetia bacterium]|nr:hypothetical protein [Planctomycetia bacterium]